MLKNFFKNFYFELNLINPLYKDFWIFLIAEILTFILMYIFFRTCHFYGCVWCCNYEENLTHCFCGFIFVWFFLFYLIIFYELWIDLNLSFFPVLFFILKNLLKYVYSHLSDFKSSDYNTIKCIHFCKLMLFFFFFCFFFVFWFIYIFNLEYILAMLSIDIIDISYSLSIIISFIVYMNLILNQQNQKININIKTFWFELFFYSSIYLLFISYLIYLKVCTGL